MKINKIFVVIMVTVLVFAGTTFEVKAFNWKDYVPDVPAWINRLTHTLGDYKNRILTFIGYRSEYPTARNEFIKVKYLKQHKAIIMGSANYEAMLDRMQNFKNDNNKREICDFMQAFVENYVKADDETKNIVKIEHDLFNERLQALREANISWFEIGCLINRHYFNESNVFINAWAFFNQLKKFDPMWSKDESGLDTAIAEIQNEFVPIEDKAVDK